MIYMAYNDTPTPKKEIIMTINKVKNFLKDNRKELFLPVAFGAAAGALAFVGYRQGVLDFARANASTLIDGESFLELAVMARAADSAVPFSWQYEDTGEIIAFTLNKVK